MAKRDAAAELAHGGMPDRLSRWLQRISTDLTPRSRHTVVSGLVVAHYLGGDLIARFENDLQSGDPDSGERLSSRLWICAESLYLLRSKSAFGALCKRLRNMGLDQIFLELSIVRRFAEVGYEIVDCKTGACVTVQRGDHCADLWTICLHGKHFSRSSVHEELQLLASRIDAGRPALLACSHPCEWVLDCWDLAFELGRISAEVISTVGGANLIGLFHEKHSSTPAGEDYSLQGFIEVNPAPRVPSIEFEQVLRQRNLAESIDPVSLVVDQLSLMDWVADQLSVAAEMCQHRRDI